jgi:ubiquinone/menaquinone biosynthesis C-methylase UbiE
VQDYYEDLWRSLPADAKPADFELRSRYLLAHVRPDDAVLDVGCGLGWFTAALARAGARPVGIDVADSALQRARDRHPQLDFRLVALDEPLPLNDNAFTVAWAGEVIEHIADTGGWLSELRRVLAPGGKLLLSTPSHGRLRLALGGIERYSQPLGDHLHLYSRRSLAELLTEFGFGDIEVRAVGGPPFLRRTLLARGTR